MKLAIVGSRTFVNENYILKVVHRYIKEVGTDRLVIVSGGCPDGADALAKKIALDLARSTWNSHQHIVITTSIASFRLTSIISLITSKTTLNATVK